MLLAHIKNTTKTNKDSQQPTDTANRQKGEKREEANETIEEMETRAIGINII